MDAATVVTVDVKPPQKLAPVLFTACIVCSSANDLAEFMAEPKTDPNPVTKDDTSKSLPPPPPYPPVLGLYRESLPIPCMRPPLLLFPNDPEEERPPFPNLAAIRALASSRNRVCRATY